MKLHSVVKKMDQAHVKAIVIDRTGTRRTIEARWYQRDGSGVPANWLESVSLECDYQNNRDKGPVTNINDIPGVT